MMARMMEKLPRHLHHHHNNNNKTTIDHVIASDDNDNEATNFEQKKEQTKLLWTGLGRGKARQGNLATTKRGNTKQDKTR